LKTLHAARQSGAMIPIFEREIDLAIERVERLLTAILAAEVRWALDVQRGMDGRNADVQTE